MRRLPTWLVVGALVALGTVAVADALRGDEKEGLTRPKPPPRPAAPTPSANEAAMRGALYYTDPSDHCFIHGLTLPDLGNVSFDPQYPPPPKLRSCRFSLAPDAQAALPGAAAWSPEGGLYAREEGGMIELGSPAASPTLRFPGRGPAFKPDGTFTYVDGGTVVEWTTDCPPASRFFTLPLDNATARCRRVALAKQDLEDSVPGTVKRIIGLAWLTDTRLVTVIGANVDVLGYAEFALVLERLRPVGATLRLLAKGLTVERSPRGNFFAAWSGDDLYAMRDRSGRALVFPPLPGVHALAWSPDERWTAVATEHSVYVFRTNEGEARIRRLPIEARDLAWR